MGYPEVLLAVAQRGGRIRPAVAVVKALASALCIGSGGSVGREGPIVQIGSAMGSTVGQALRMSDDRIRTLVACGAAGGIAATFNAPIAGVFFALEVIVGEFTTRAFGVVVMSSVTASVISRAAFWRRGRIPGARIRVGQRWRVRALRRTGGGCWGDWRGLHPHAVRGRGPVRRRADA